MSSPRQLLQEVDAAGADLKTLVGVNQKLSPDRLVVMLLLYCLLARKDGAERCRSLLPHIPCYFFREGLAMVMDGFERSFTRDGFARLREEIILMLPARWIWPMSCVWQYGPASTTMRYMQSPERIFHNQSM